MAARPANAENATFIISHGQVTADTTTKEFTTHPYRRFVVEKVQYLNPTGLTNHASDYFNIKLKKGTTVVANWSTQTSAQGAIAADTVVSLVLATAVADRILPAGQEMTLLLDETGTQTLPAGKLFIHGYYRS